MSLLLLLVQRVRNFAFSLPLKFIQIRFSFKNINLLLKTHNKFKYLLKIYILLSCMYTYGWK